MRFVHVPDFPSGWRGEKYEKHVAEELTNTVANIILSS